MRALLAGLLVLPTLAQAVVGAGPYGGLRLAGSARDTGTSGAFRALEGGGYSVLGNPAQGAFERGLSSGFSHLFYLASTGVDTLVAGASAGELGRFDLAVAQTIFPRVELRDSQGALTGSFVPAGQLAGLAWSRELAPGWGLGLQGRYLRQDLQLAQFQGYGASVGLAAGAPGQALRAGLAAQMQGGEGLPQAQTDGLLGLAWAPLRGGKDLGLEFGVSFEGNDRSELKAGVGAEALAFGSNLALRAGYAWSSNAGSNTSVNGLAFGLGLRWGSARFDYGARSLGDFGWAQSIALSAGFGSGAAAAQNGGQASAHSLQAAGAATEAAAAPQAVRPSPVTEPQLAAPRRGFAEAPAAPALRQDLKVISEDVIAAEEFEAKGQWREALGAYRAGAEKDPRDVLAWKGLARLYMRFGQKAYARTCLERVAALDPQDPDLARFKSALE